MTLQEQQEERMEREEALQRRGKCLSAEDRKNLAKESEDFYRKNLPKVSAIPDAPEPSSHYWRA